MRKIALHKLSHFIQRNGTHISLAVVTGTQHKHESLKRALFLADVSYDERSDVCSIDGKINETFYLRLHFTRYNQLKYIIPIVNKYMIKFGFVTENCDFYYIDDECKRILI